MKVQMKVQISGTRNGAYWPPPGGEIDLTPGEADDLIAAGIAEPAGKAETTEPEQADPPAPKKRTPRKATARKAETR